MVRGDKLGRLKLNRVIASTSVPSFGSIICAGTTVKFAHVNVAGLATTVIAICRISLVDGSSMCWLQSRVKARQWRVLPCRQAPLKRTFIAPAAKNYAHLMTGGGPSR